MAPSYLTSIWASPMLMERRPVGRLFFNMESPISERWRLYIETGPRFPSWLVWLFDMFLGPPNVLSMILFTNYIFYILMSKTKLLPPDRALPID